MRFNARDYQSQLDTFRLAEDAALKGNHSTRVQSAAFSFDPFDGSSHLGNQKGRFDDHDDLSARYASQEDRVDSEKSDGRFGVKRAV